MAKSKNTKKKALKNGFHITLSIKGCFLAGSVFFLGIVWAFILGVIVGRGYGPIDIISPLKKRVLPSSINSKSSAQHPTPNVHKKVLSPTELTFLNKVRQNDIESKIVSPKKSNIKESYSHASKKEHRYQYIIQISSFRNKKDALSLVKRLHQKKFSAKVEEVTINGSSFYRVLVVIQGSSDYIQDKMELLSKMGFKDYIVKMRKKL
ncbi:SPOR domain-containing protein [Desulfothermus naphthae]